MKKPLYTRWWFWVIVGVFTLFVIVGVAGTSSNDEPSASELLEETAAVDRSISDEDLFATPEPSEIATAAPTESSEPTPSAEATPVAEATPSVSVETAEPTPAQTVAPATPAPTPEPTPAPTPQPTPEPTPQSTPEPTPATVTVSVHGTGRDVTLPSGTLVWIPATGTKFHNKNNCGNMNPDKATQITVDEAQRRGYDACEKCY